LPQTPEQNQEGQGGEGEAQGGGCILSMGLHLIDKEITGAFEFAHPETGAKAGKGNKGTEKQLSV
jgi:hypothetical protein